MKKVVIGFMVDMEAYYMKEYVACHTLYMTHKLVATEVWMSKQSIWSLVLSPCTHQRLP